MSNSTATKITRDAHLRWIAVADMRINPLAQRDLVTSWVDKIAANFDPEDVGTPIVSHRDGHYYIIDGQHRVAAMKQMGWGDQQIQCWVYEELTEEQEAERFLKLNDVKAVAAHARFRVGVTAGRVDDCEINRVVLAQGLRISQDSDGIQAIGTLRKVYTRANSVVLGRTVRIIRDAYGDAGFKAPVIEGLGLLCQRYNGQLDDTVAKAKLGDAHGGVNGLLNKAQQIRVRTGHQRAQCVAAAAVEIINAGRGGKKLPDWWKSA